MIDLYVIFHKTNIPIEIVRLCYMLQISTINHKLKEGLLQMYDKFYDFQTRKIYIKKHNRMLMKYRMKEKLNYYMKQKLYLQHKVL